MERIEFSDIEKEMLNFNFAEVQALAEQATMHIASAEAATEVRSQICEVWGRIRKFVVLAENIPVIGKYIKIMVTLLDSLCG